MLCFVLARNGYTHQARLPPASPQRAGVSVVHYQFHMNVPDYEQHATFFEAQQLLTNSLTNHSINNNNSSSSNQNNVLDRTSHGTIADNDSNNSNESPPQQNERDGTRPLHLTVSFTQPSRGVIGDTEVATFVRGARSARRFSR